MYVFLCTYCLHFWIYLQKCAQISVSTEINACEGKRKKISVHVENLVQMFPEQLCRAASENPTFYPSLWFSASWDIMNVLSSFRGRLKPQRPNVQPGRPNCPPSSWFLHDGWWCWSLLWRSDADITCNFVQIRKPEEKKNSNVWVKHMSTFYCKT